MRIVEIKIVVYFIVFALICSSFSYLLIFKGFINKNSDFMLYLSSAVIQAYAALIAIPLTISVVHLSRMYGSPLVDVLIKESTDIFVMYAIIVFISVFNIVVNPAIPKYMFIMLSLQLSVCVLPLYPLIKRLGKLLSISPPQIMKILGYPIVMQKLIDKGKLFEVNTKLLKGLSLIRSSIMDPSLRDYLSETLEIFSDTISTFPWTNKEKAEERKLSDGRVQRMDMQLLLLNIVRHLNEYIVDPLKHTKILPDPRKFSSLYTELFKAIIRLDKALGANILPLSTYDEYFRSMTTLIETFIEGEKIDALNLIFWSFFEGCREGIPAKSKSWITARVVSRALSLSSSSIRKLKANAAEKEKIRSVLFIADQAFQIIKYDPRIFAWLDSESIDDWEYLIEEGSRTDLGWMIICLPFVEKELNKIKEYEPEFIYNRALANLSKILSKIKEKLVKNQWVVFVTENSLDIMNIKDRTIGSVQFKNILQKDEIKLLQSFVMKYFK